MDTAVRGTVERTCAVAGPRTPDGGPVTNATHFCTSKGGETSPAEDVPDGEPGTEGGPGTEGEPGTGAGLPPDGPGVDGTVGGWPTGQSSWWSSTPRQ